ncbi:MAG: DUF1989 domain-containing protein, partial [Pseudomonadota bacterium]
RLFEQKIDLRACVRFDVNSGDLLYFSNLDEETNLIAVAFDDRGNDGLSALNLAADKAIEWESFDNHQLKSWISTNGGRVSDENRSIRLIGQDGELVLKASSKLTVWIVNLLSIDELINCQTRPVPKVGLKQANTNGVILPPPLGEVREEFTVSRGSALSYQVKRGEFFQIIDVEGQQCSDFMAFRRDGLDAGEELMIDSTATRSQVRCAFPGPGLFDKFFDADMRPMLKVVQDTCGRHDTFGMACTARGYEERGFPGHVNCSDNISDAVAPFGVKRRSAWPAINFFWNTWIDPHSHALMTAESHSRAGDYVAMEAMDDLVCVSTACPDDIDPINGWNPTDVHVRIYKPDTRITRAIGYREKEDAPMTVSEESAFHERLAPLTDQFAPARNMWAPITYPSWGTIGEYWACREKVTLQDMSGLRKFDIIGPDAGALLQLALTRDVAKLAVWRGTYTLMCDEAGTVIDDGTLFRMAPDLFRWCCGSEESGRWLEELASKHGLQVRIHDMRSSLPNLALQGPKSRDLLRKIVFTQPHVPNLDQVKWFGATVARLEHREGAPFMLTRSGYTGELGYEIFCSKSHAVEIWDKVMEAGEEFGITPMGSAALEMIRIEAGLAAANAEFAPGIDAYEAGLGFAVDLKKADFVGKQALERNAKDPRKLLKGLILSCEDIPHHGSPVLSGERQVGVVTSATRSPMLEKTIAIVRLAVEHSENGTELEVGQLDGHMKRLKGTISDIPFIDPQRKRARA